MAASGSLARRILNVLPVTREFGRDRSSLVGDTDNGRIQEAVRLLTSVSGAIRPECLFRSGLNQG